MSTSTQILGTTVPVLPKQDANPLPAMLPPTPTNFHEQNYIGYSSPFERYPLLQTSLHSSSSDSSPSFKQESSSSSLYKAELSTVFSPSSVSPDTMSDSIPLFSHSLPIASLHLPDLKPLKRAAAAKLLDPFQQICQYEVPGGGVCRDARCRDLHLSRGGGSATDTNGSGSLEPSDQDTAEYLHSVMPSSWLSEHDISIPKILSALQEGRIQSPLASFDERVAQAIAALEPPPPLPSPS